MRDAQAVLAKLGARGVALADGAALRQQLEALAHRFPSVTADALSEALARRGAVDGLHLEAVLFVEACLAQDPEALAELDGLVREAVRSLRRRADADEQDELSQRLRIRLLVPTTAGGPPKLCL
jgi:hypothetical protein